MVGLNKSRRKFLGIFPRVKSSGSESLKRIREQTEKLRDDIPEMEKMANRFPSKWKSNGKAKKKLSPAKRNSAKKRIRRVMDLVKCKSATILKT